MTNTYRSVEEIVEAFEDRLGGFIATQGKREKQDKDNAWLRTAIQSLLKECANELREMATSIDADTGKPVYRPHYEDAAQIIQSKIQE